jgi:hypothetical protein
VKQHETVPSGERAKRLLILANALGKARRLTDAAMGDDVGDDLFSEWQKGIGEPPVSMVRNDRGSFNLIQNAEEWFKKEVAGLAALEVAAQPAHARPLERARYGPATHTCWPASALPTLKFAQVVGCTGATPYPGDRTCEMIRGRTAGLKLA